MEENKYKYLVNISNLVRLVKYSINTGCCPDDSTRYIVTVRSKDRDVLETFHKMRMREDMLFCISTQVAKVLILVDVDHHFDNIHHTFDLNLIGTEYSLDSEFAKGLKRINSLDDIEKSHSDEPGEQGTTSGIPLFSDVVDVLNVKHECGSTMTYVTAARTDKTFAFLTKWDGTPPPREFLFSLRKDDTDVFKLINVCIDFNGVTFEFSYYGNVMPNDSVSISVPALTGPRGAKPLQLGMLTYKREDAMPKGITDVELRPNGEIYAKVNGKDEVEKLRKCLTDGYWDCFKDDNFFVPCGRGNGKPIFDPSNPEHRSIIMQGSREMMMPIEDKFPQLHRARLNKPKSI